MQLNVYVPKGKANILRTLDEMAKRTGKQKNELVLEAYLAKPGVADEKPRWETFNLGVMGTLRREEIYDDDFYDRILGQNDPSGR